MTGLIILNHNTWEECTRECLQQALLHTAPPFEIVMVDNGSESQEVATICEELARLEQVKLVRSCENLGFAAGINLGLVALTGIARLVCFLNSDCFLYEPAWNEKSKAIFDEDERLGAISLTQGESCYFLDGELGEPYGFAPQQPPYECEWINGACFVMDRSRVGSLRFDEEFGPAYWEDVDLSFQIRAAGWSLAQRPDFEVVHLGGVTAAKTRDGYRIGEEAVPVAFFYERNRRRMFGKWQPMLHPRLAEEESRQFLARFYRR